MVLELLDSLGHLQASTHRDLGGQLLFDVEAACQLLLVAAEVGLEAHEDVRRHDSARTNQELFDRAKAESELYLSLWIYPPIEPGEYQSHHQFVLGGNQT